MIIQNLHLKYCTIHQHSVHPDSGIIVSWSVLMFSTVHALKGHVITHLENDFFYLPTVYLLLQLLNVRFLSKDIFSHHMTMTTCVTERKPLTNFCRQDTGSNVTSPSVAQMVKCRLIISKRDNSSRRKILKSSHVIWDFNPVHLTLLDTSWVSTKCFASIIQIFRKLEIKDTDFLRWQIQKRSLSITTQFQHFSGFLFLFWS